MPLPVGVWIRPDSPASQRCQASRWKGAGFQPRAANQARSGSSALRNLIGARAL
ncbi:hypothetical protein P873_05730 [Arenimonas composti TR7-09 = DSM 18010]|uniref:Uncharacterized protein n=1 Tax=Arenimonas composti TR7-09 = DSM 18010 TaxID=1121013 RepID=A0A091C1Z2_9GAMM|nr:hypothetical protein P873_05730 [Arenimonas composti TR7-09 = DSM 18010]